MKPRISIIIVNWNHKKYLLRCLDSIRNQILKDFEVIIIDNNSKDGSKDLLRSISSKNEKINLIENNENVGFAQGNNQGIELAKSKYILFINPDIILDKHYLKKIVTKLEDDKAIGALTGKLLRYDFKNNTTLNAIDSTGLIIKKNRRVFDRGQNERDIGQYNKAEEVFGVSAAAAIYRKQALDECKLIDEYFDENFFAYKEDIDLSWRLRLFGWKIFYLPEAIAYHGRGTGALSDKSNIWQIMKNRRRAISTAVKRWSYRNQRLTQMKNELWQNFLIDSIRIISREILTFGYILIFEPGLIKGFFQIFKYLPQTLKKRKIIMKNKKVSWSELSRWFR